MRVQPQGGGACGQRDGGGRAQVLQPLVVRKVVCRLQEVLADFGRAVNGFADIISRTLNRWLRHDVHRHNRSGIPDEHHPDLTMDSGGWVSKFQLLTRLHMVVMHLAILMGEPKGRFQTGFVITDSDYEAPAFMYARATQGHNFIFVREGALGRSPDTRRHRRSSRQRRSQSGMLPASGAPPASWNRGSFLEVARVTAVATSCT